MLIDAKSGFEPSLLLFLIFTRLLYVSALFLEFLEYPAV